MTVMDLLAVAFIIAGIGVAVMIGRVIWCAINGDLNDEYEDEHAQGLSAPWNRRKR